MRPRLRAVVTRVGSLLRRVARRLAIVPLRLRGIALLGAGAIVTFWIGRSEADYVLYPAGITAMALVAVCAVCVTAGAIRVRIALRGLQAKMPPELETRAAMHTGFQFPRLALWPMVDISLAWDAPANIDVTLEPARGKWQEVITARGRGRYTQVVRRFTIEDILGLTAISFSMTWNEPLRIAPQSAASGAELALAYGQGDAFSHPSGRLEGDLVEMRQYGHGDPMRHILWKTFARSRRLLVRMPERAVAPRPTTVAFLIAGPGDEPTCATARLYLERDVFGRDVEFWADGATTPARNAPAAIEQIIDSAAAATDSGAVLETQAAQADRARLGACVVFAPAVDGPWRERVVAFSTQLPAPPTVIIGVDGEPPPSVRRLIYRVLIGDRRIIDPDSRALAGVPKLRAALEENGMRVHVIHRSSGAQLP